MKPDERALLFAVSEGAWPRDVGQSLGINYKRVDYLCYKWSYKGWYDYGVTVDMGWLTPQGKTEIERLLATVDA